MSIEMIECDCDPVPRGAPTTGKIVHYTKNGITYHANINEDGKVFWNAIISYSAEAQALKDQVSQDRIDELQRRTIIRDRLETLKSKRNSSNRLNDSEINELLDIYMDVWDENNDYSGMVNPLINKNVEIDQDDEDGELLIFKASSVSNDVSKSIADNSDLSSSSPEGWLKIRIEDNREDGITNGYYYIPFYTIG